MKKVNWKLLLSDLALTIGLIAFLFFYASLFR
jgi:hypothetical protein